MTETLGQAARTGKNTYAIVRQQLRATQEFIAGRSGESTFKPFEIMRLLYDHRYVLLEHMVGSQNIRVFLRNSSIPIRLPEIAHAGNRQLRRECLLVALNKCTIEIHSGPGNAALQAWLSKIDFTGVDTSCKTGFDAITSLTFPYFSRFPYHSPEITRNNDVGLALACKNLRSLSIDFVWEELGNISARNSRAHRDFAADCARDIRKSYQLDYLLDAAKLEKLQLKTLAPQSFLDGLAEVAAWFERGFGLAIRRLSSPWVTGDVE